MFITARARRDSQEAAVFKIKLDNGTHVEIAAGPKDSEFAEVSSQQVLFKPSSKL